MRSMTSSRTRLRRAAPTWAAHTYAASRSRTAVRMATERSFASTRLSSRKKVTRPSTRSASFGLWSSMLNGPRTLPNTPTTASTTAWCSAGTSDLPVIGATRGMMSSLLASVRDARGDGDLDEELGRVQRRDGHRGPRRLAGREVLRVLLVVGREILALRQMRHRAQDVVERRARGRQDQLDALEHVARLLPDVLADFARDRMAPRLAGHEDEVAELRGG